MNLKIKIRHSKFSSNISYTQNVRKVGKQNLFFSKICNVVINYKKGGDCESYRPLSGVLVINDNKLWTNNSWRNKNAGMDHRIQ
jgi:hypothetical protein